MVISVSRRTDIPAFYSNWFFNRVKEGYVYVRNPMSYHRISKISLDPEVVDCFVFWTKNPEKMLDKLHLISDFNYYFTFTLTSYDKNIELNVPRKRLVIDTFRELSEKIGADRVIWRYDPIFFTDKYNEEYHLKYFEYISSSLQSYTKKCVISFLDVYKKCKRNMNGVKLIQKGEEVFCFLNKLKEISKSYNIEMFTCAEEVDLSHLGIWKNKCIDDRLISHISNRNIDLKKDKTQRDSCGCMESIDIGVYNTCKHNCLYCYANYSHNSVKKNSGKHFEESPLLVGFPEQSDIITERKMRSNFVKQEGLF